MILRSSLLLALVSSSCNSFSPLLQTKHNSNQKGGYRSATRLFDSEQPSTWEAQKWSVELAGKQITSPAPAGGFASVEQSMAKAKAELASFASNGVNPDTGLVNPEAGQKRKIRASVKETGHDSMRNYIKSMCNHDLLNKNEEIILAREIQILLKWEKEREELEQQLLRYVILKFKKRRRKQSHPCFVQLD